LEHKGSKQDFGHKGLEFKQLGWDLKDKASGTGQWQWASAHHSQDI